MLSNSNPNAYQWIYVYIHIYIYNIYIYTYIHGFDAANATAVDAAACSYIAAMAPGRRMAIHSPGCNMAMKLLGMALQLVGAFEDRSCQPYLG